MVMVYFGLMYTSSRLTSTKSGVNVTTKYWASKGNVNYRRFAVPGRAWNSASSPEIAAEAIPAQPNCRHWQLPTTPVWDCDVYHGPLQRDRRRVWRSSIASLAGKRH